MSLDQQTTTGSAASFSRPIAWWTIAAVLMLGIFIGRTVSLSGPAPVSAADPGVEATATRKAELNELDDLRTKVAQPVVCTPAPEPTVTPTPTIAPPVAAGTELTLGDVWTVTVTNVQAVRAPDDIEVNGHLVVVTVQLNNVTSARAVPFFRDWRLTGPDGAVGRIHVDATTEIVGPLWVNALPGNSTDERQFVFDVPGAAGDTYLLESDADVTFRVELKVEQRG